MIASNAVREKSSDLEMMSHGCVNYQLQSKTGWHEYSKRTLGNTRDYIAEITSIDQFENSVHIKSNFGLLC